MPSSLAVEYICMTVLRNLGRDTVVVAGRLTDHCRGTTARQVLVLQG
ncbi:hypothetical protein GCM10010358_20490 [Streptomyces minutiscleroticus]|uniref:Uncharacterized protein n=1 Tax=Streptomyces minutiscleroticus TaxID=68238 RepID=A0A918NGK7_9ACTN|nr:hypothetical protein [Streptomyces minutiscleroticus]GGX66020.1 hypothetical protein GCM10010358_20490 [Streptomyces minutiscleroticus]